MCACCLSFMGSVLVLLIRLTARASLSGVLPAGVGLAAVASGREPPAHLLQHPFQLRVRSDRLVLPGLGGDQPQEAEALDTLLVTGRSQDRLDRGHALLCRDVPLRGALRLQRAQVEPVLEEPLDELVVAGRGLRPMVAVNKPEVLETLALRVGERHGHGLPTLLHRGNYLTANDSRTRQ